jgi:hypothetical protein
MMRRSLRKRWIRPTAAAAVPLVLLALAGRTDACNVKVLNHLTVNLNMDAYNGWDGFCSVPFQSFTLYAYGCTCDRVCALVGLGQAGLSIFLLSV